MIDIGLLPQNESGREYFKRGEVIFREGDEPGDKIYILLSGSVDIVQNYGAPGEIIIASICQGDFFGEMALFLDRKHTAAVIVREDAAALTIRHSNARDFFARYPDVAFAMMKTLCERLDRTNMSMTNSHFEYERSLMSLNHEKSELELAASIDALTGIYNRRYFMVTAPSRLCGDSSRSAFITMLDLDHFKRVNDTYGHPIGDIVLKSIADTVSSSIRPYDLFARYGGEEFILLTVGIEKESVLALVERLRLSIKNKPIKAGGNLINITASFGVAALSAACGLETAIAQADEALYKAKNEGRDRVVFYTNLHLL